MKKLTALLLALIMVLAMNVSALAAGNTGDSANKSDGSANTDYAHINGSTFSIKKEIVLFNVDQSTILDPNVVYTYSVTSVDVDDTATVTGLVLDDTTTPPKQTTSVVKDGVDGGVTIQGRKEDAYDGTTAADPGPTHAVTGASATTTTLTFGGDNFTKTTTMVEGATISASEASGKVAVGYIDVSVDAATIYNAGGGPGIYRYKISDTTSASTLAAAGITRVSGFEEDLFLDVYVKNNAAGNGFEVYGYVLFKSADENQVFEYDSSVTTEIIKVDGYTVQSDVTNADSYHTYNVEVTKTTTGDLADKRHNFPFEVTLSNAAITSQDDFYYVVTTDGTAGTATSTNLANNGSWVLGDATTTPASSVLKFQDGDGILITGLPAGTKVTVKEYNDTNDTYKASAKDESNAALNMDNTVASGSATTNAATVDVASAQKGSLHEVKDVDCTTSKDIVAIINTIDTISPTGVVLRVAPYAIMLGAGIILFIILKVRKNKAVKEA